VALGTLFLIFEGPVNRLDLFMYFGIPPGSPKAEARQKVEGKSFILGPRRQTKSRLPITILLILRLLVQMT
jgi:hypothetical protein